MMSQPPLNAFKFRTIFLSDLHLGTTGAQAEFLLEFLREVEAETIYLVGDIVDGWRLREGWYWPQAHNDVVQKILRKGRKGSRIVYIPGNHDEFLRDYVGTDFGAVELRLQAEHICVNGEKLLIMHGDEFDVVIAHARWLAFFGDWAYRFALWLNTYVNRVRRYFGFPYWSLSAWAKLKVKNAVSFIGRFENMLSQEARKRGAFGVVCGHIHHAAIKDMGGVMYYNCGDWVESCTALVEDHDGCLRLIHWMEARQSLPSVNTLLNT